MFGAGHKKSFISTATRLPSLHRAWVPGLKGPVTEADHSLPFSSKHVWSYAPAPQRFHGVVFSLRENLQVTFTFNSDVWKIEHADALVKMAHRRHLVHKVH